MFFIIRITFAILMLIAVIILLPKVFKGYKTIAKSVIENQQTKTDYYKTQQQVQQQILEELKRDRS